MKLPIFSQSVSIDSFNCQFKSRISEMFFMNSPCIRPSSGCDSSDKKKACKTIRVCDERGVCWPQEVCP